MKSGNKSDQIDARKLAELLRAGMHIPFYRTRPTFHSQIPAEAVSFTLITARPAYWKRRL